MTVDSALIGRKESYGVVCEWRGDQRQGTATVDGGTLRYASCHDLFLDEERKVFKWGGLRLRVLGMAYGLNGCGADLYYVKLDSPHSQLYAFYRERAERLLRFAARLEAAIRVFRELPIENVEMPFTKRLADRLL